MCNSPTKEVLIPDVGYVVELCYKAVPMICASKPSRLSNLWAEVAQDKDRRGIRPNHD